MLNTKRKNVLNTAILAASVFSCVTAFAAPVGPTGTGTGGGQVLQDTADIIDANTEALLGIGNNVGGVTPAATAGGLLADTAANTQGVSDNANDITALQGVNTTQQTQINSNTATNTTQQTQINSNTATNSTQQNQINSNIGNINANTIRSANNQGRLNAHDARLDTNEANISTNAADIADMRLDINKLDDRVSAVAAISSLPQATGGRNLISMGASNGGGIAIGYSNNFGTNDQHILKFAASNSGSQQITTVSYGYMW